MNIQNILQSENVAADLDSDTLRKVSNSLANSFNQDIASRAEWERRNESWMKLAMQVVEPKNTPWPNASNVKYPLLTTAAIQFNARSYPALVQGKNIARIDFTGFDPTGERQDSAIRVSKHMSYQILTQMEEWEESMDRLLFTLPIVGTAFKKSYFDSALGRNVSEYIHPYDLVVNYNAKSLDSASQKTHILHFYKNEIMERVRSGYFMDVALGNSGTKVRESQTDDTQGFSDPHDGDDYDFLEIHCWLDLDDDDYKEPYVVTMLWNNKRIVRIVPRFNEEGVEYNYNAEVVRIVPEESFTSFTFIPDPDSGVYGLGFGALLGPLNDAVNTLINQLIDSGTLSNSSSGFLSRSIKLGSGDVRFKPNEWKYTNTTADDLRKGIYPLPVNQPSTVLFSLLGHLVESGQKLSSTMDIMMGESPGQNQAATTTMAVLEQGLKVYTSIHKRIYRSFKSELKKLYRLNSIYLNDEEYFRILDLPGQPTAAIAREDYHLDNMSIEPAADPSVVAQSQKLLKAEALMPLMQSGLVNRDEAVRRMLEAQEQPNIEALLQMPPPQPDPELVIEQTKLEHQINYDNKKLELDAHRIASEAAKDEAQALQAQVKSEVAIQELANSELAEEFTMVKESIAEKREEKNGQERMGTAPGNAGTD